MLNKITCLIKTVNKFPKTMYENFPSLEIVFIFICPKPYSKPVPLFIKRKKTKLLYLCKREPKPF